jgi:hypothetical protein
MRPCDCRLLRLGRPLRRQAEAEAEEDGLGAGGGAAGRPTATAYKARYGPRAVKALPLVAVLLLIVAVIVAATSVGVNQDCVYEAPLGRPPPPNVEPGFGPLYRTCEWRVVWTR